MFNIRLASYIWKSETHCAQVTLSLSCKTVCRPYTFVEWITVNSKFVILLRFKDCSMSVYVMPTPVLNAKCTDILLKYTSNDYGCTCFYPGEYLRKIFLGFQTLFTINAVWRRVASHACHSNYHISALILAFSNDIHYKVRDEINYPFPNFNGWSRWSLEMDM